MATETAHLYDESDLQRKVDEISYKRSRSTCVFAEKFNPEEDDSELSEHFYPKSEEQRQRILDATKDVFLFRSLDHEMLQKVLDAMFEKKVEPGESVIHQGDDGDNFYIIDNGSFEAYVEVGDSKKLVGQYDQRGSFGELALMYNMPRSATVLATSSGVLWALDRQTFRRIVLKSAYKKRLEHDKLLQSVPMLQTLTEYERMSVADALVSKSYSDGEVIIKEAESADGIYFVDHGTVLVSVTMQGKEIEVSRLKKGEYFGELALVHNKPRSATVTAIGPVKVAFLDVAAFERLLGPCMELMKRNAELYEEQLAHLLDSTDLQSNS